MTDQGHIEEEENTDRVAIDVAKLHLLAPAEAIKLFDSRLGSGTEWASELMRYRTTSEFQSDWKIEVGNWLERARQLGFLDEVLRSIRPERDANGMREAGDPVHRNVMQRLAQAEATHYFVGTGWGFHAWEPKRDRTDVDIDFQLIAPAGVVVDFQIKASGTLGLHDNVVDKHIQQGVRKAAAQLPRAATRPALIAVLAQRDWPLYSSIYVIESFIGSTVQCHPDDSVLLLDRERGELSGWKHVSGIVVLDHIRGADSLYCCAVIQNPWADVPVDPAWFPYARVLTYADGRFAWCPTGSRYSTFPTGTRLTA